MRKYPVQLSDGSMKEMSYIGLNHTIDGKMYDNIISSYYKYFDTKDEFIVTNEDDEVRIASLGDVTDSYMVLREEISARCPRDTEQYLSCILTAIEKYFGAYSNRKKRNKFYPTEEEVSNGKERGKISELSKKENKNIALSLERAVIAQNFLMWCCMDVYAYFKVSACTINGKNRVHSYNLLHDVSSGKYYICDFSIPAIRDGNISPIICEIPKDVFNAMISPLPDVGYTVEVEYHNLVNEKNYLINYDAGRDDVYHANAVLTKKKV